MGEFFWRFDWPVMGKGKRVYTAAARGSLRADGKWEGWLEFTSSGGHVLRTPRETTQPNRDDLSYWASGISPIYLEGALARGKSAAPRPAKHRDSYA